MKFSTLETKVSELLTDTTNVTWTLDKVQGWLSEAQRQIVLLRPDANSIAEEFTPVAGSTKQSLPTDAFRLLDIPHTIVSGLPSSAITIVSRITLDKFTRSWHNVAEVDEPLHYVYNDQVPEVFYLYPKPSASTRIEIHVSKIPDEPDFNADPDVTIHSGYEAAMIQYAVWRCLSRADDQSPDTQAAELAYQKFIQLLGMEAQSKNAVSPSNREQHA